MKYKRILIISTLTAIAIGHVPTAYAGKFAEQALVVYNNDVQPLIDIANQGKKDPVPELSDIDKCYYVSHENLYGSASESKLNEMDCAFTYTPDVMPEASFQLQAHMRVFGVPLLGTLEANCYGTISMSRLKDILFANDPFPQGSKLRNMYQFKVDGCLNVLVAIPYCIDIARDGPRTGEAYAANASLKGIAILYGAGYEGEDPDAPPVMKCQAGWAALVGGASSDKRTTRMLPSSRRDIINEYYDMYKANLAKIAKEKNKKGSRYD